MTALQIMIGYDPREDDAYEVCRKSLIRRSSKSLHIVKLERQALEWAGLFNRRSHRLENGQRIDSLDGKPFSTDFSFTRFLVPALALYQGWALFCDCDFLFTADISVLFGMADDRYAVMCVKHEHVPTETVKMDGIAQTRYRRKNWSSLVLWNCGHPKNRGVITRDCVNKMPGGWLHAFSWLEDKDIGGLPPSWNWLAGVDPERQLPCGIHFTLGIPSMPGHENTPYADLWRAERDSRRSLPGPGPLPDERLRALDSRLDAVTSP